MEHKMQLHKASVISAVLSLMNSHRHIKSWFIVSFEITRWLILHMLKQVAERIQIFVNLSESEFFTRSELLRILMM